MSQELTPIALIDDSVLNFTNFGPQPQQYDDMRKEAYNGSLTYVTMANGWNGTYTFNGELLTSAMY